jgi:phospholipase/carboxylesterase
MPDTAFASPHAPERCAMSGSGFQWFALSRIDPHEVVRGVEGAAPALDAFLDAELARYGLTPDRLALVGFSQGTMMALQAGLRRRPAPAAIVGFSGMLAGPDQVPDADPAGPPVLLLHGDADQVIPPGALFAAAAALGMAGVPVQWHLTAGLGHGIDEAGMMLAGQFLTAAFRGALRTGEPPIGCRYPR